MDTIYKAQPIAGEKIRDLHLVASEPLPEIDADLTASAYQKAHRDRFDEQADIIMTALKGSLPQGTLDALLVKLLDYKRSIFVVR